MCPEIFGDGIACPTNMGIHLCPGLFGVAAADRSQYQIVVGVEAGYLLSRIGVECVPADSDHHVRAYEHAQAEGVARGLGDDEVELAVEGSESLGELR
jgi:hypothetical protein